VAGTDAAPYLRIFNPLAQGRRFDPDGEYVRRWLLQLRHLAGAAVHEPWRHQTAMPRAIRGDWSIRARRDAKR
jgi:deoxyribodipyrimidine photolyase